MVGFLLDFNGSRLLTNPYPEPVIMVTLSYSTEPSRFGVNAKIATSYSVAANV